MRKLNLIVAGALLLALLAVTPRARAQGPCGETYTVAPGDTLAKIALRCNLSVADLLAANPQLTNPALIFPGQQLRLIPQSQRPASVRVEPLRGPAGTELRVEASDYPPNTPVEISIGRSNSIHTVVDGTQTTTASGTLSTTVTIPAYAATGELWVVTVATAQGQRIEAVSNTFAVTGPALITYTVQRGDYLARIARQFGVTLADLIAANPQIANPSLIYSGQVIYIPLAPPATNPAVTVTPLRGAPGTEVTVTATGFPPDTPLEVGLGRKDSEYKVIETGRTTGADGRLETRVTIPSFADQNELWVITVATSPDSGQRLKAASNTLAVTAEGGSDAAVFDSVQVYLIALEQGQVGCGDAVQPVTRTVAPTHTPLTAAIRELLSLRDRTYGLSGLYNALYRSNLRLDEIRLHGDTATIWLSGEYLVGGVCDEPRVAAQLRQTALQFESVEEVEVFINNQPLRPEGSQ